MVIPDGRGAMTNADSMNLRGSTDPEGLWLMLVALLAAATMLGPIDARAVTARAAGTDAAVLAIGARVADWQLSHMDQFEYVRDPTFRHDTAAPRNWIQAAFYIGLAAFADASRQPRYVEIGRAHV